MPIEPGNVELVAETSLSLALLNAVNRQQLDGITAQAVTVMGAALLGAPPPSLDDAGQGGNGQANKAANSPQDVAAAAAAQMEKIAAPTVVSAYEPGGDMADDALDFVAQSVALSVQDASNFLRNLQTLCTAATANCLAAIETPEGQKTGPLQLEAVQLVLSNGAESLLAMWTKAVDVLKHIRQISNAGMTASGQGAGTPGAQGPGISNLEQAVEGALSTAVANAVTAQQQANIIAQASTTMGVSTLYSLDTAEIGITEEDLEHSGSKAVVPAAVAAE